MAKVSLNFYQFHVFIDFLRLINFEFYNLVSNFILDRMDLSSELRFYDQDIT